MVVIGGSPHRRGPLPEQMPGESVRLRVTDGELEIRTDSGRVLAKYPVEEATEARVPGDDQGVEEE